MRVVHFCIYQFSGQYSLPLTCHEPEIRKTTRVTAILKKAESFDELSNRMSEAIKVLVLESSDPGYSTVNGCFYLS